MTGVTQGVESVVTALRHDDGETTERWFRAIRAAYDESDSDWDIFAGLLRESGPAAGVAANDVENFLDIVAGTPSPITTIGDLADIGDDLPGLYYRLTAPEAPPAPAPDAPPPPPMEYADSWAALIEFVRASHAQWDGTEHGWPTFRAWLTEQAAARNLADEARDFLTAVEGDPDKRAVFTTYEIPLAEIDLWAELVDLVRANGERLDGTDENWATFREWLRSTAGARGLAAEATDFITLVDGEPDKRSLFATYEIPIAAAVSAAPRQAPSDPWTELVEFVRANGRRWKGTDQSWTFFKGWLLAEAGDRGLRAEANDFVTLVEGEPDKRAVFTTYDIPFTDQTPAPAPPAPPPPPVETGTAPAPPAPPPPPVETATAPGETASADTDETPTATPADETPTKPAAEYTPAAEEVPFSEDALQRYLAEGLFDSEEPEMQRITQAIEAGELQITFDEVNEPGDDFPAAEKKIIEDLTDAIQSEDGLSADQIGLLEELEEYGIVLAETEEDL